MTAQARSELSDLFVFIDLTHFWPALVWLAMGIMLLVWLGTESVLSCVCIGGVIFVMPRIILTRAVSRRQRRFAVVERVRAPGLACRLR